MAALFERLQVFAFDEPSAATPFTVRLARANGWTVARARRVVGQCRRFLWLAMRAGLKVSPSPSVEVAWREHLCHTRSYWDDLCGRVLGRPLHHEPSRGGPGEAAKHAAMYAQTLASYRRWFGEPPADVWPPVVDGARFAPWARRRERAGRAAVQSASILGLVGLASCSGAGGVSLGLAVAGVVTFVAIVVAVVVANRPNEASRRRKGEGAACGGGIPGGADNRSDAADSASGDGGDGGNSGDGGGCGGDGGGGGD
jgi:hypothetical protein